MTYQFSYRTIRAILNELFELPCWYGEAIYVYQHFKALSLKICYRSKQNLTTALHYQDRIRLISCFTWSLQLILCRCFISFLGIKSVVWIHGPLWCRHKIVLFLYSVQYQEPLMHEHVGKTGTAILRKTNLCNTDFGNWEFVGIWDKPLGNISVSHIHVNTSAISLQGYFQSPYTTSMLVHLLWNKLPIFKPPLVCKHQAVACN